LHIISLALGGCLKAEPVPYGITEDTGGHITYILGEMEALARRNDVTRAEIVTRRFHDPRLGPAFAQAEEWANSKLVIRRIDSGNSAYLAKQALSDDREAFTGAFIADLKSRDCLPDVIHAHFADAADVAARVEAELGIPFIYTAHSLGMDKARAIAKPCEQLKARIAEEDRAIAAARAVIGSSRDECERQLIAYPSARIGKIHRLIPGISLPHAGGVTVPGEELIAPFLRDPAKPMVLAIARPVHKKNLASLIDAFGSSSALREKCNLVVLAGLRTALRDGEAEQREVLADIVDAIDRHDLYGSVAYPKAHDRAQVDALYRLAHRTGGVFVNPALMEPYGLTLVEAAAYGLPVVATEIGGPTDIVGELQHGLLVDPRSREDVSSAIEMLVSDKRLWSRCSRAARTNSAAMNWDAYAKGFVEIAREVCQPVAGKREALRHLLVSDLDNTLTGCSAGAVRFGKFVRRNPDFGFVIATGRSIVEARRLVREWGLPQPVAWITSVGTEIHLETEDGLVPDGEFASTIAWNWQPERIDEALESHAGLVPQAHYEQRAFKRSFFTEHATIAAQVRERLDELGIAARVVFSHDRLLDIMPLQAGKAAAMQHVARMLGVPPERVFAAGDSGNDADMLMACDNAILVGNHASEVAALAHRSNVYRTRRHHGLGTLEGVLTHHRARQARERKIAGASA